MLLRDDILSRALELSPSDRAYVVDRLEESLAHSVVEPAPGDDAIVGEEFVSELQRRSAAYRSGQMTARPAAKIDGRVATTTGQRAAAVKLQILS